MGHCVMVCLWCESLLTNTRFRFLDFRMNLLSTSDVGQEKRLPNDSERPLTSPPKKMAAAKGNGQKPAAIAKCG